MPPSGVPQDRVVAVEQIGVSNGHYEPPVQMQQPQMSMPIAQPAPSVDMTQMMAQMQAQQQAQQTLQQQQMMQAMLTMMGRRRK